MRMMVYLKLEDVDILPTPSLQCPLHSSVAEIKPQYDHSGQRDVEITPIAAGAKLKISS
jgi:hypothetical protein